MITKEIISTPINPFDQQAASVVVYKVAREDNAITCQLVDSDGSVIEGKRVYKLDDSPFDLGDDEIKLVEGEKPTSSWLKATNQLWLDGQQSPDEDGNVSEDDPFYYASDATKSELLALVPEDENETG